LLVFILCVGRPWEIDDGWSMRVGITWSIFTVQSSFGLIH